MSSYDLTISPRYVQSWGVPEAMREIFQNAFDHQSYDISRDEDGVVRVTSYGTKLSTRTLLLGEGTKKEGDDKIGQFGEGYKLALLTLLRHGCEVQILNGIDEIWKPRIKRSRKFESELLSVDIKRHKNRCNDVDFVVGGIRDEDWMDIIRDTRPLQKEDRVIPCKDFGTILTESTQAGRIYVGGLFVGKMDLSYGYDIKPTYLALDRDRRMVRQFDLEWLTSRMWMSISDEKEQLLVKLLAKNVPDVRYAGSQAWGSDSLAESAYKHFVASHGENAYPASGQEEVERLKQSIPQAKIIMVGSASSTIIQSSSSYQERLESTSIDVPVCEPHEEMLKFFRRYKVKMASSQLRSFKKLLTSSQFWQDKRS